jgi:hypothetical protein
MLSGEYGLDLKILFKGISGFRVLKLGMKNRN